MNEGSREALEVALYVFIVCGAIFTTWFLFAIIIFGVE